MTPPGNDAVTYPWFKFPALGASRMAVAWGARFTVVEESPIDGTLSGVPLSAVKFTVKETEADAKLTTTQVLSRPQRITLGAQTAEILRASILRGELKPGQKLVEREMAEAMGISQGSIREALRALEYEGLVTKKTNTATYFENDGSWSVEAYVGLEGKNDIGMRFDIEAIAGCNEKSAAEYRTWPDGTARSKIVTVTRK